MLERLSKTHRNLALLVIGALLIWFSWTVRSVLNPLILGYLLAFILRPLVQKLQDRGMGRRPAVNIIFVTFGMVLLIVGGAVFIQARQFVENQIVHVKDGDDLFTRAENNIDGLLGNAASWIDSTFRSDAADALMPDVVEPAGDGPDQATPEEKKETEEKKDTEEKETTEGKEVTEEGLTLRNLVKAWTASLSNGDESSLGRAQIVLKYFQRFFGGVMSLFGFLALLPVYTYFLLFELERIHDFVRLHVPKRERERATRIGRRVGAVIANFFRGRLLICLLKGLVLALGLTLLQIPYGFLLGVVSGFLSLIPFVGPMIGFVATALISVQAADPSGTGIWVTLGLMGGLFILAEILEGYVFIPKILGDTLGLHPVVILLSVFVGGAALGFFGFLLAIPLAATLIILFRELVMPALEDFAEEDSHVDGPRPTGSGESGPGGGRPAGGSPAGS